MFELLLDIDQLEELSTTMSPAVGAGHGALPEHLIEAGKTVDLKDAAVPGQMTLWMLAFAIAGVITDHTGRREAAEGTIVAHVIPDPGDIALILGQQR